MDLTEEVSGMTSEDLADSTPPDTYSMNESGSLSVVKTNKSKKLLTTTPVMVHDDHVAKVPESNVIDHASKFPESDWT